MKKRWVFASITIAVLIAFALCLYCKYKGDKSPQRTEETNESALNRPVDEVVVADGDLSDEVEDDVDKDLIDRYRAEATALSNEFNPIRKRISKETIDFLHAHAGMYGMGGPVEYENEQGRWDKEYWRPLFEKSREAMKRVAGSDDLLEMWENNIFQKLLGISKGKPDDRADTNIQLDLTTLYLLALLNEKRDEILDGTVFENSKAGVEARTKIKESIQSDGQPYAELPPFWGCFVPFSASEAVNDSFIKNNVYSLFPPNGRILFDFDRAWLVMAIYSYKNKRSQKILYELFKNDSSLATLALQYITLNDVDDELKAEIKNDLKQTIAKFQEDYPEIGKKIFNSEGELLDQSMMGLEKLLKDDPAVYCNPVARGNLARVQRYLLLDGAIDFDEKIPTHEKKRWEIVRRELILTRLLISSQSHKIYYPTVFLKADEANFPIYLCASTVRPLGYASFYIETQGERRYTRIDESFFYDHRKYYDEELEAADSIFNKRQKAYAREVIQYSERMERSQRLRNRS